MNTVALSKNSIHYSLSQQRSTGYLHYSAVKGKKSYKLKKVNLKAFHTDDIEKYLSTVERITRGQHADANQFPEDIFNATNKIF